MDKLKPVLTHIFWILFVVALLVPAIGWFMGTGKLAAAIDERIAALNSLNPQDGATVPNDRWIEKVAEVKEERQQRLDTAADFLWSQQQQYMTWPRGMQQFVEGKIFEDDFDDVTPLNIYRNRFDAEVEKLRQIVDPYEWDYDANRWGGKVVLEPGVLPLPMAQQAWPSAPPQSKEIWYLQEDIWLLRGLLESVRDLNDRAGPDANIMKVPIKQIVSIELKGGNPAALEAGADASGYGGAHGGGYDSGYGGGTGGMMPPGDGYGGIGGAMTNTELDFDLAEEVGPAGQVAAAGGDGYSSDAGYGADAAHAVAAPGGLGGLANANPILSEKRYVDESTPYKTRAFKMSVIIDHRQLPEFLVELTNSPFPVRVLRVHFMQLNQEPGYASATPSRSSYGGEYSGATMPGGGLGLGGRGFSGASRAPMSSRTNSFGLGGGLGAGARSGFGSRSPAFGARSPMAPPFGAAGARGPAIGARGPGMLSRNPMGGGEYDSGYGSSGLPGQPDAAAGNVVAQALSDPYLAQVVVGGLMTIYRSPEEQARVAAGGDAATIEETAPAEVDPATGIDEGAAMEEGTADSSAPEVAGPQPAEEPSADAESVIPDNQNDPTAPPEGATEDGVAAPPSGETDVGVAAEAVDSAEDSTAPAVPQ